MMPFGCGRSRSEGGIEDSFAGCGERGPEFSIVVKPAPHGLSSGSESMESNTFQVNKQDLLTNGCFVCCVHCQE
eukprot:m.127509 g.127509  ORF g.127509 m.127509 type:complete len:74 (-) comp14548_c0_seq1:267-488(-)